MNTKTALIDADVIKWRVSAAGETRSIIAHHPSGISQPMSNRTAFWGNYSKRDGGWLSMFNSSRDSPLMASEWVIEDVVKPDPIENVLHSAKMQYKLFHTSINASKHKGFVGKGKSFREDRSTIIRYKGNRVDSATPYHLEAVVDYLEKYLKCEVVRDIEVDDILVMESYRQPDKVVIAIDKDMYGTPVLLFNPDKPEEGILDCNCFGSLSLNGSKVRGVGRLFLYYQVGSGDIIDNYRANSASDIRWGSMSAYKALVDCKNDKEALSTLKDIYQKLYPSSKTIKGWRGDDIEVDWLYCLSENFDLARMLRWEGDTVNIKDVLTKMGII